MLHTLFIQFFFFWIPKIIFFLHIFSSSRKHTNSTYVMFAMFRDTHRNGCDVTAVKKSFLQKLIIFFFVLFAHFVKWLKSHQFSHNLSSLHSVLKNISHFISCIVTCFFERNTLNIITLYVDEVFNTIKFRNICVCCVSVMCVYDVCVCVCMRVRVCRECCV